MTADLSQARECREHMHLAFVESFFRDDLRNLLAAAAELREIKFPLQIAEFAIAPSLDSVRQILSYRLLQTPRQERPQLRRQWAAREPLRGRDLFRIAFATRLIRFVKMFLRAEITGLDEIDNAPQVEEPVFQRRAGKREPLVGPQLLHRLRDLRRRVLDELRFVEHDGGELKFLQFRQVAPQ